MLPSGAAFARKCCRSQQSTRTGPDMADVSSRIRSRFVKANAENRAVRIGAELDSHFNRGRIIPVWICWRAGPAPDAAGADLRLHVDRRSAIWRFEVGAVIDGTAHQRCCGIHHRRRPRVTPTGTSRRRMPGCAAVGRKLDSGYNSSTGVVRHPCDRDCTANSEG